MYKAGDKVWVRRGGTAEGAPVALHSETAGTVVRHHIRHGFYRVDVPGVINSRSGTEWACQERILRPRRDGEDTAPEQTATGAPNTRSTWDACVWQPATIKEAQHDTT